MSWYHILGLYLTVVLGLIVLVIVQAHGAFKSLSVRRRSEGKHSIWMQIWRWLRYVARCGRRRKKRAKPTDDRREERRALRRQLREEAEEWLSEWIEKFVELGDDLLEAEFDDDEEDEFFLGYEQGSGDEDSDVEGVNAADSSDERQVVYGLVNTGNSCFFNSVLQALASAEYLQNYLSSILERMDEINDTFDGNIVSMPLTEALWETLTDLNAVVSRDSAFQPFAVMAALGSRQLNDREQQDAQEAFQLISTALSDERQLFSNLQIPSLLNAELLSILSETDERKTHILAVPRGLECAGSKGLSRVKALMKLATLAGLPTEGQSLTFGRRPILQNPFTGLKASRLSCVNCGYTEAVRHFAFDNISLSLPLAATCTLDQVLRRYVSMEKLYDCPCRKCTLSQTLRELIQEIKCATDWLNEHSEYDIEGICDVERTEKEKRRSARAVAVWKRIVLEGSDYVESSTSESEYEQDDISNDSIESYPVNPVNQLVKQPRALPPPHLANVPDIIKQLRTDANEVASALRYNVQRSLPGVTLRSPPNPLSTKQEVFAKLPPCLCLHLSRSTFTPDGYTVKNPCHVRFPEYLDFSPYTTTGNLRVEPEASMIDQAIDDSKARLGGGTLAVAGRAGGYSNRRMRDALEALGPDANVHNCYRLQAVVVHIGSHSYGHFITYRRKPRPPMRSGVNTPRYRSGSVVSMPAHSSTPSSQVLEKRYASATPQTPSESSDGMRKRRIVGGNASSYATSTASEASEGGEFFTPPAQPTRPKRSWRVTDAMTAEWYLISDEDVQAVTLAEVLNANPYLLIYERIDGPQTQGYAGTPGIIPSLSNLRNLARRSTSVQFPGQGSSGLQNETMDALASPVSESDETLPAVKSSTEIKRTESSPENLAVSI
ncbi:ubiquitin-specific protease ubp1 [Coemansia brasiliensis]|uniref:Ubiquitin carboxyl-terminal hydrolase n=1 Tax=Coemansia brasiliensis TaxID=2650707 RepID=A0A9W8LZH8_9FUNG|nr:ubiquitin-specific protease ubp1 [Coemansia brasiliensis]